MRVKWDPLFDFPFKSAIKPSTDRNLPYYTHTGNYKKKTKTFKRSFSPIEQVP